MNQTVSGIAAPAPVQASEQLDFAADDSLTGFRLARFELLNWGTFDRRVWRMEPQGRNALLTGDIGSGKSTLVDALTTLLVPHQRIVYNKAAGAEGRERSLASYVRGEYKSEQDVSTQSARAVALRDEKSYSVLLAQFDNHGFSQQATLAQVFWLKEGQRRPERFFVFSETPLSITEHFSGFGGDIRELRKRLRKRPRTQVLDQFKDYANRFRRFFGIAEEGALELFYQTVSMKSVGNLTEFVRQHMLERFDAEVRIEGLRRAFDNLNRAHQAVLKAREQIQRLRPLVADGQRHAEILREIDTLTACRSGLEAWFASHRVALTERQIQRLEGELSAARARAERLGGELEGLQFKADSLRAGIEDQGGSRLRAIDQEIQRLATEQQRRQQDMQAYRVRAEALGLEIPGDEVRFQQCRAEVQGRVAELETEIESLRAEDTDLAVRLRGLKDQGGELEQEIASLRQRRSNIPRRSLEIRARMAADLDLSEEELPFAGELLQVDQAELPWQGAIERLLHGFGVSLLVPDSHYAQVTRYVDGTRLGGRLVYYRTRSERGRVRETHPQALCRKLNIRPDSPFYEWLEPWLARHFDHVCCDGLEDFRRHDRAVTRQGQLKSGGRRHEKDDRHDLQDASRFVLGWSNEDKIRALEQRLHAIAGRIAELAGQSGALKQRLERRNRLRDHGRDLLHVERFEDIHWQAIATSIDQLEREKRTIEQSSDALQSLRTQLRMVQEARVAKQQKREAAQQEAAERGGRLSIARESLVEARGLVEGWPREQREALAPRLEALHQRALEGVAPSLQNLGLQQRTLREHLQGIIDNQEARRKRLNEKLIAALEGYRRDYPAETREVDASIASLAEYGDMLMALETEDLPRHEQRFRDMLREETIQGLALFRAQLEKEQKGIGDKIDTINRSLQEIEYNPGTYIRLGKDATQDAEIRQFLGDLRQLLAGSLDEEALYTEEKFLQVKSIIDRFNGREGLTEQDRRWTRKVTDVRNWFNFSASERWREDDSEREFYSDAAGKSGGQKEKLAYTILASALAYQFGLEWGNVRSRSFRFVVIDEAFGKGSDESTRYALELFRQLNLQLLIVTPLQKIHIIEDYIHAVHFVHNEGGRESVIRNLTLEEYRALKCQATRG